MCNAVNTNFQRLQIAHTTRGTVGTGATGYGLQLGPKVRHKKNTNNSRELLGAKEEKKKEIFNVSAALAAGSYLECVLPYYEIYIYFSPNMCAILFYIAVDVSWSGSVCRLSCVFRCLLTDRRGRRCRRSPRELSFFFPCHV